MSYLREETFKEDVFIRIHQYEDFVECLILQQIEPILFIKIKTKI